MSNIGHVKYNKPGRSSSVCGGRGGYGTASLTKEFVHISQAYILIYILINEILFSDVSDWDSTSLTVRNETCQISKDLKVDGKCPFVSQPVTENQSACTNFRPVTLIDEEKMNNIGTVVLLGNCTVHDLCESQLPENRESKESNEA